MDSLPTRARASVLAAVLLPSETAPLALAELPDAGPLLDAWTELSAGGTEALVRRATDGLSRLLREEASAPARLDPAVLEQRLRAEPAAVWTAARLALGQRPAPGLPARRDAFPPALECVRRTLARLAPGGR